MSLSLKDQAFLFYKDLVGVGRWACRECATRHVPSTQYAATVRDLKARGHRIETKTTGTCDLCEGYSEPDRQSEALMVGRSSVGGGAT